VVNLPSPAIGEDGLAEVGFGLVAFDDPLGRIAEEVYTVRSAEAEGSVFAHGLVPDGKMALV